MTHSAWSFGMTIEEILALPLMEQGAMLAGSAGAARVVDRLNMMEVPDVLPWVRPGEMLVTSGYPLRDLTAEDFARLVTGLAERGLSGLCVKFGRFVPDLAPEVASAADDAGFPILSMPKRLSFTDLLGAVLGEQLDRQEAALRHSDEVDRLLLSILVDGGGHPEIAGAIATWLGAHAWIVQDDGLVVADAKSADVDHGEDPSPGPAPERFDPATLPSDADDVVISEGNRTVACIRTGSRVHGYLVVETPGPPVPGHLLAVRRAAPAVALAFARTAELAAVESRYRGDLLRSVLLGTARVDADLHTHAERMGWTLDGSLCVAVAQPVRASSEPRSAESSARVARELRRALIPVSAGAAVHGYTTEVVVVMPAPDRSDLHAAVRAARAHLPAAERGFRLGVSPVVEGLAEVPSAYRQAREALAVAVDRGQETDFTAFEDIGLARLVTLMAESQQSSAVVDDALAPLLADRNSEDLLDTLETFLATNCNVAETARRMRFHYNTIRYRVARLEQVLGPFAGDAERRAELLTACRLRSLLDRRL